MNPNLKAALICLGFGDIEYVPKMKLIRKQYLLLSNKQHPDKPGGTKEAFQKLLDAYNTAGEAAEHLDGDDNDVADVVARKLFQQFKSSAITENTTTFTILIENSVSSCWDDVLHENFGTPVEKENHGRKFKMVDSCLDVPANIFITLYKTNKVLVQAKKQAANIH